AKVSRRRRTGAAQDGKRARPPADASVKGSKTATLSHGMMASHAIRQESESVGAGRARRARRVRLHHQLFLLYRQRLPVRLHQGSELLHLVLPLLWNQPVLRSGAAQVRARAQLERREEGGRLMGVGRVGLTLGRITSKILGVFKKELDDAPDGDVDKYDGEQGRLLDVEKTSAEAARDELKESLNKYARGIGMTAAEAELWFEHSAKKVIDSAEKIRKAKPKAKAEADEFGAFFMVKVFAVIAAGGWVLTAITGAHPPPTKADKLLGFIRLQSAQRKSMDTFEVDEAQFNAMVDVLEQGVPAPPTPSAEPEPVAAVAAPEPLPPAVAAVADHPVTVEVDRSNSAPRTFESTVGQVYRSAPPAAQP